MKKIKTILFIVLMGLAITIFTRNFQGIAGVHNLFYTHFLGDGWPFSYYAASTLHSEIPDTITFDLAYFVLDTLIWTAFSALLIFILGLITKRKFFDTLKLKSAHLLTALILSVVIMTVGIVAQYGYVPFVEFNMIDTVYPPCSTANQHMDYSGNCGQGTDVLNIPNMFLVLIFLFPVLVLITKPIFLLIERFTKAKSEKPAPAQTVPVTTPPAPPTTPTPSS